MNISNFELRKLNNEEEIEYAKRLARFDELTDQIAFIGNLETETEDEVMEKAIMVNNLSNYRGVLSAIIMKDFYKLSSE